MVDMSTPAKSDNESIHAESDIQSVLRDWSGRGSHVDFLSDEAVPLTEGRGLRESMVLARPRIGVLGRHPPDARFGAGFGSRWEKSGRS